MTQPPAEMPPPPPAGLSPVATAGTNAMAVVSLATGIGSWFLLPVVGAVIAVVTGHIARREIRQTGEQGGTFATIGLVLGYLHLAVAAIVVLLLILLLVGVFGAIAVGGIHSQ